MDGLIATSQSILKAAQLLGFSAAAIAFCVGGYFLMLGGDSGRRKSVGWFVGAAVGLVIVMGAMGIAKSIDANIKF